VARTACLDAHQTRIEPLKKPQYLRPAHRLAYYNFSRAIHGVDLKNVLGQIAAGPRHYETSSGGKNSGKAYPLIIDYPRSFLKNSRTSATIASGCAEPATWA
jgi:hypothetical protein